MDKILPTPINKEKLTKTICVFMLIFCLAPIVLNIVCIAPLYSILYNNIQFQTGPLPTIIHYIMDFFDVLAFTAAYALIIFSLTLLKKKNTVLISLSYVSILILKIPLRLLMEQLINHSLTNPKEIIMNLLVALFYFVIEILQFLTVFAVATYVSKKYLRAIDILSTSKRKSKYKVEYILPIKKFLNKYNPLLRISIYSGLIIVLFRVLTQLITDIELGAPTSLILTIILIILYATSIIYGVVSYFLSIFIFNKFYKSVSKETEKANEDTSSALPKE